MIASATLPWMCGALCSGWRLNLAQRDEALGGGEVLEGDAHARVLCGEAQEAPDAEHKGDIEAGDAKAGQRLPDDAALHPLQQRNNPEHAHTLSHQNTLHVVVLQRRQLHHAAPAAAAVMLLPQEQVLRLTLVQHTFCALLGKGLPGPVLQSLPAVRPAAARVVHRLPLVIQVTALHAPPDFIPLHRLCDVIPAFSGNELKPLLCAVSLPSLAPVHRLASAEEGLLVLRL